MAESNGEKASDGSVGREVVTRIASLLGGIVVHLLDRWVVISGILGTVAVFLGYVALLPPQDRLKVSPENFANAIGHLIEGHLLPILAWVLLAVVTIVASTIIYIQHQRIRRQGAELIRFRDERDPNRLPANDRQRLLDYGETPPSEPSKVEG